MARRDDDRMRAQRAQQKRYRDRQRAKAKPSRDDVARMALHVMLRDYLARGKDDILAAFGELLVEELVDQGFDREAAGQRFDDLLARTAEGWRPRPKRHLVERKDC